MTIETYIVILGLAFIIGGPLRVLAVIGFDVYRLYRDHLLREREKRILASICYIYRSAPPRV
jgi:hypothetical protein